MTKKIELGEGVEIHKPRKIVLEALQYVTGGSALDLGAGFGRHSLLLAHKGFTVTAVEMGDEQIETLKNKAAKLGVSIQIEKCDVRDFDSHGEKYDMVLSTMVFHFLSNHDEAVEAIRKMQGMTNVGGINVVCAYTDASELGLRPYLLNAVELKKIYENWEMLKYEVIKGTDADIDGPDKGKLIWRVEMIARKK